MSEQLGATVSWVGHDGVRRVGHVVGTAFSGAFVKVATRAGLVHSVHARRVTRESVTELVPVLVDRPLIGEDHREVV